MFAVVLFSVYYFFKKPAPIGYNVFPPDLQEILDERISSLTSQKGVCIAGQVSMSDGKVIRGGKDVLVNLCDGIDEPLRVYDGGWFIMRRTQNSAYAGGDVGFILRSFGYDPIDASVTILDGELTYLEFVMQKTETEMLKTKNFGRKSLNEIKSLLEEMDLSLGMKLDNFPLVDDHEDGEKEDKEEG